MTMGAGMSLPALCEAQKTAGNRRMMTGMATLGAPVAAPVAAPQAAPAPCEEGCNHDFYCSLMNI
jgi:hypothetical protein